MGSSKTRERCIAEDHGGRRVSVSGHGRGDASDALHPTLSVEVKGCKKLTPGIE
jgi:hypothetical protein